MVVLLCAAVCGDKMRFYIKYKAARLILILFLVALCLAVPAYLIFQNAKGLVTDDLGNNAIDIAATVAAFVEKDIEQFNAIPIDDYVYFDMEDTGDNQLFGGAADQKEEENDGDLSSGYFAQFKELLETIEAHTGADRIYIEKKLTDSEKVCLFAGNYPQSRNAFSNSLSAEEHMAFNEGAAIQSGILLGDASDEFIAGYAPIFDLYSQETVAIVAVEFSVDYAEKIISGIRNIISTCFVIIFLLTSFVVYKLLKSRLKYIKTDYLTELCNKRYFEKELASSVKGAKWTKRELSLVMLDIDHFKNINDKLGHVCGDNVIKTVANILMKLTRDSDVCCHYGGDEFAIIMPDTNSTQAVMISERIRNEVSRLTFTTPDNKQLTVTLSIGIAELKGDMAPESLVKNADDALYKSKNAGKNCTFVKQ